MKPTIYTCVAIAALALSALGSSAQTWRPKNAGLPSSFFAKSVYGEGTRIYVANTSPSSGSQMYYTPDSSTAFTGSTSSLGLYAAMETGVVTAHGLHFVGGIGGVYKSADNGVTWTISGSSSNQHTFALHAAGDTIYASMGNTTQLPNYSTDDGATWTLIPNYTGTPITKFLRYNGVLYVGGSSGFQYTTDMGATWVTVSTPTPLSGQNINGLVLFRGAVYASCINGVFRTTDNGSTWTNVTTKQMNCMAAVDTSIFCGTANAGIYRSDMAATTWTNISTGLSYYISTLHYSINDITSNNDYVIAAASNDPNSIYVIGLSELGLAPATTENIAPATVENTGMDLVPNPAQSQVTIRLSGKVNAGSTVSLISATGQIVKQYGVTNATDIRIDVDRLPQGIYFVRLATENMQIVKKLTVTH